MPTRSDKISPLERAVKLEKQLRHEIPQLMAFLVDSQDFRSLHLKARDDGTTLSILKCYGDDGGEVVCFGVGYGFALTLMALESTIAGGHWRVDKPWEPGGK